MNYGNDQYLFLFFLETKASFETKAKTIKFMELLETDPDLLEDLKSYLIEKKQKRNQQASIFELEDESIGSTEWSDSNSDL